MHNIIEKNSIIKLENALYVVATPIGNLNDITIRALQTLASADFIVCEDTRVSSILLHKFKITKKKLIIYNDFSDKSTRHKILNNILQGFSVAIISDAGTPLISDPGYKLVNFLRENSQKIISVPGPSALTASLSISGIACDNFLFIGFLPNTKVSKENKLKSLPNNFSFVFFEVANRVIETLQILAQHFSNRQICVARELTKIHEEILFDPPQKILEIFQVNPQKIRGEFVIIVEKISKEQILYDPQEIKQIITNNINQNISNKDIINDISNTYSINKKAVYQMVLNIKNSHHEKINKPKNSSPKIAKKITKKS
jgi:16S rRNA (cytidine1402-2'-O)-methyltransferase